MAPPPRLLLQQTTMMAPPRSHRFGREETVFSLLGQWEKSNKEGMKGRSTATSQWLLKGDAAVAAVEGRCGENPKRRGRSCYFVMMKNDSEHYMKEPYLKNERNYFFNSCHVIGSVHQVRKFGRQNLWTEPNCNRLLWVGSGYTRTTQKIYKKNGLDLFGSGRARG